MFISSLFFYQKVNTIFNINLKYRKYCIKADGPELQGSTLGVVNMLTKTNIQTNTGNKKTEDPLTLVPMDHPVGALQHIIKSNHIVKIRWFHLNNILF